MLPLKLRSLVPVEVPEELPSLEEVLEVVAGAIRKACQSRASEEEKLDARASALCFLLFS